MAKKPPKNKPPVDGVAADDELPVPPRRGANRTYKEPENPYEQRGYWQKEIAAAKKREDNFRSEGKKIRGIYAGEKKDATPFNILFSNTEVILPSLYSQTPRPVVQRRYKDKDPLGLAAAQAGQRVLEFMLDTNIEGYETFHDGLKGATLDGLLPGRGVTSVKYDADVVDIEQPGTEGALPVKNSELICMETRSWDRVLMGYAKKWSRVPWISYELDLDYDQVSKMCGKEVADAMTFTAGEDSEEEKRSDGESVGERKTATVYQIWDKLGGRKLRYYSPSFPDTLMKSVDDPLNLTGFFDTPRPLQFVDKTNDMMPTALYTLYENQAAELNTLTTRISRLAKAIKARGLYDTELGDDIAKIMEGDDNELIPADKSASLAAEKGLDNAIWFMPLDVMITTLRELYAARENCKQVIYEIMGISDIVRGASKASETLGAQQLKSQWGTLRLKNKQAEVQRYARDHLRMMLEIASSKFSQETWAKMTGLPFLTDAQFQKAQQQYQAMQGQIQQGQQITQTTGQQPDPQIIARFQQQMQQLQATLQQPKWTDVIALLKDDMQRAYRIDIETNSTVEPEAVEDQKNIADLMTAMGQFLNGVGPLVAEGVMPFEVAKTMLMSITRRFKFGSDIEDQIAQMQPPKPQDDGQKKEAAAAQQKMMQMQSENQKLQAQVTQLTNDLKAKTQELALATRAADLDNRARMLQDEQARFKLEKQSATEHLSIKTAGAAKELDHKKQVTELHGKAAQEKQQVAKQMEGKLSGGVEQVKGTVEQLVQMQKQLATIVQGHEQKLDQIEKLAKAPRKRTAIRGKDGRIEASVDEIIQ